LIKIAKLELFASKENVRSLRQDQGGHHALPAISATSETATTRELVVFACARKRAFACCNVESATRRLETQIAKLEPSVRRAYATLYSRITSSRHVAIPRWAPAETTNGWGFAPSPSTVAIHQSWYTQKSPRHHLFSQIKLLLHNIHFMSISRFGDWPAFAYDLAPLRSNEICFCRRERKYFDKSSLSLNLFSLISPNA
jgi:hypothetical protein